MDQEIDLSDPQYDWMYQRSLHVSRDCLSEDMGIRVRIQSVATDSLLKKTYVSDLGNNVIHLYVDWKYQGVVFLINIKGIFLN